MSESEMNPKNRIIQFEIQCVIKINNNNEIIIEMQLIKSEISVRHKRLGSHHDLRLRAVSWLTSALKRILIQRTVERNVTDGRTEVSGHRARSLTDAYRLLKA